MAERVTAVMVTSGRDIRRQYAKVAIHCFHNQRHSNKHLLILNHGDALLAAPHPDITEVVLPEQPKSLGELRNRIFEHLPVRSLVISWDDDDWYDPSRISVQLSHMRRRKVRAVVLARYLSVDMTTGIAFVRGCQRFKCGGCCGTILFEVGKERYDDVVRGEDAILAETFRASNQLAIADNPAILYVRTYHGNNVSGRDHILRNSRGRRPLLPAESKALQPILAEFAAVGQIVVPGITD